MKKIIFFSVIIAAFIALHSCATKPVVVAPSHPAYLQALSDLRLARAYLDKWDYQPILNECHGAINEIDSSIGEIKDAAIWDGKNLNDHPPVDANLSHKDRLTKALSLLNHAYGDIDERETNPASRNLRNRALNHLDKARQFLIEARKIAKWIE